MNGAQITFFGRITREPEEIAYTREKGTGYLRLGVAVSTWVRNTQEEETTFYSVTLWGNHAENALSRCHRGDEIYVQGEYRFREYSRRDGTIGHSHDVNARDFRLTQVAKANQPAAETVAEAGDETQEENDNMDLDYLGDGDESTTEENEEETEGMDPFA